MVELGVFLPVLSSGWVVSTPAPQYQPPYEMNKAMTQLAEETGRDVGAYVFYTLVLGETEAEARDKSKAGGIIGQD